MLAKQEHHPEREGRIVLRRSTEFGITHGGFAINMAGVRERKRKMVCGLNEMSWRITGIREPSSFCERAGSAFREQ